MSQAAPSTTVPSVLGTIVGKCTTREFTFEIQNETKVFEYLKVYHRVFGDVLSQVTEITTTRDESTAHCEIIGYRDPEGAIKSVRIPFDVGSQVERADDEFIRQIIKLGSEHGAYIGKLEGRDINVHLDLRKILTKHVAVLAKSGAGKSYSVGVLIEEVLEKGVPLVIIDPHGEYATLSQPNTSREDVERMRAYGVEAKGYKVNEYGDPNVTSGKQLKLSNRMTQQELVQMIPAKLTGAQIGILYAALRNIEQVSFDAVIASLGTEESNAKWGLINILEHLQTYNIFSSDPTPYDEIVNPGVCSIINLRGIPAEIQAIIVYKLTKDLFELRKLGRLPPFFLVLEEAHNFCPERSFGETTASKTIRTIASEGRKFGLGLCVISQRPARLDKSVISQCTTQLILKVTNPNDLKAISASVEGLTADAEKEIANLPIGTSLVTGIVEVPLLVNIRPRRSLHGGHSVDILSEIKEMAGRPKPPRPIRVEPPTESETRILPPSASSAPTTRTPTAHPQDITPPEQPVEHTIQRSRRTAMKEPAQTGRPSKEYTTTQQETVNKDAPPTTAPKEQQRTQSQRMQPVAPTTGALPPGKPIAVLKPKKGIMDKLLKDKPISSVQQRLVPAFLATCTQGGDTFRLVVERREGAIVTSIDAFLTKKVPDLKRLSREEITIIQSAYTAGKVDDDHLRDPALQGLIEKGYLVQEAENVKLSDKYLFQRLSRVKSDDDLEFTRVTDATMEDAVLGENEVRMLLAPFVTVKTLVECYILRITAS
ncbi:TPA: DUF87 domain-containing protein [Candidatus Woesearchaeota archaeon]|nr:DUF87 domain-containing protein [Candidatus Woesearchaeota archaeon]